MSADIELANLRDEVLRKIGRNAVNFQKMEAMLKLLNAQQSLTASPADVSRIAAQARRATSKQPMGRLVATFVQSIYSEAPIASSGSDTQVTFSFQIEANEAVTRERKKALSAVVAERNRLIHKWLAEFDPNSLESCQRLSAALDEQHAKILPEFEALKAIFLTFKALREELARYVVSDDFLNDLRDGQ